MKIIRCENGHFYDGSIYPICPHCNSSANLEAYRGSSDARPPAGIQPEPTTMPLSQGEPDPMTMPLIQPEPTTMPLRQEEPEMVTMPLIQPEPTTMPLRQEEPEMVTMPLIQPDASSERVLNRACMAADDVYQTNMRAEPVTGWLVCLQGEDFGRGYPLKRGSNFIGGSIKMDVSLKGDGSIAKEKHAEVFYDAQLRIFTAKTGASRERVYLNDKILLEDTRLRQYDILSVGDVNLMFIPCCGEKFSWEDIR